MGQRFALAARDADIQASIEPVAVLAGRYGISAGHVKRIRAELPQPPVRTRKERFQLEVVEGGWRADCMDEGEWTDWVRQNPMGLYDRAFAERPCRDCPLGFAADMRAIGRCNGTPGNPASEPADHGEDEEGEDEGPMLNQNERSGVRAAAPLELVPPPCATCLHEPVCVLKIALRKATSAEVSAMPLPDGLSVVVTARVECRFYNRAKGTRGGSAAGRTLNLSPEERARRGEQARANTAAKIAARATP